MVYSTLNCRGKTQLHCGLAMRELLYTVSFVGVCVCREEWNRCGTPGVELTVSTREQNELLVKQTLLVDFMCTYEAHGLEKGKGLRFLK